MQQGEPDKKGPGTLVGNPPGFSPVTAESFVESGVRWVPTRTAATSGVRMPTNGGLLLRDGAADGVSAGDARLEKRVVSATPPFPPGGDPGPQVSGRSM